MMSVSKSEPRRTEIGTTVFRDKRMTRPLELQLSVGSNFRLRRVHRKRQLRPRKNAVQLREDRIVDGQVLLCPATSPESSVSIRSISLRSSTKSSRSALLPFTACMGSMKNVLPEDDTS